MGVEAGMQTGHLATRVASAMMTIKVRTLQKKEFPPPTVWVISVAVFKTRSDHFTQGREGSIS